jgi:hypothetical protein
MLMQHYGHQSAIVINVTFGTNETKVNFIFVNLLHVSK